MASQLARPVGSNYTDPQKEPEAPSEKPTAIWLRRSILVAFWAVVVFFGLPHWIWTTSIQRSELPLDRMNDWADGKACDLYFPITVDLFAPELDERQTTSLQHATQQLLAAQNLYSLYTFNVISTSMKSNRSYETHLEQSKTKSSVTLILQQNPGLSKPKAELKAGEAGVEIQYPHSNLDSLPVFISESVTSILEDEQASISKLLEGSALSKGQRARHLDGQKRDALNKRSTRSFKPASTYHLTFSMFAASASPSSWDVEGAFEEYLAPLLQPLSATSDFTVDTQVQLYAAFSPSIAGPMLDETDSTWKLQQADLSGFINAAEWPLSPSIGTGPTINLVLYVPTKDQTPMSIAETGGTTWIIPQWGGVQIFNPSMQQSETLSKDDLQKVMLTFGDQIASLLGLPPQPASLSLRISSLTRERTTALMLSAASTLGALSRLTLKLTSIAIPDNVSRSVDETISRLDQTCSNIRDGNYQAALEHARTAEEEAEKAFFEPSMVGQVYFPDEHKVAVYVPLLGPMSVPLIMTAVKEIKGLRNRLKQKHA